MIELHSVAIWAQASSAHRVGGLHSEVIHVSSISKSLLVTCVCLENLATQGV